MSERIMDNFESGIPGDIASNLFAVHPYGLAEHFELGQLVARQLFKALLHQVDSAFPLVFTDTPSEQIIGVKGRRNISKGHKTKNLTDKQSKLAFFKQLFVTTA